MNFIKKILYKSRRVFFTSLVKLRVGSHKKPLYVNGFSSVTKKTILGKNVSFNGMSIKGCGEVQIGDNFHSGIGCMMVTQNHNYEGDALPYDNTYICKKIIIEDNVWLGHRVIILGGVTIGEGAIVQAGSVIVNNIPKYAIAGGHPAKVFKYRDVDHYKKLKNEKKFI